MDRSIRTKIAAAGAALLLFSLTCGCAADSSAAVAEDAGVVSSTAQTYTVQVTSVADGVVNAEVGELADMQPGGGMPNGGSMPDENSADTVPAMPDGAPSTDAAPSMPDETSTDAVPAKPDENSADAAPAVPDETSADTAPAAPDGEAPAGNGMPEGGEKMGGVTFTTGGETIIFNLTEDTAVTVENAQSAVGSIADIATGTILTVTLDDDWNATEIVIRDVRGSNADAAAK